MNGSTMSYRKQCRVPTTFYSDTIKHRNYNAKHLNVRYFAQTIFKGFVKERKSAQSEIFAFMLYKNWLMKQVCFDMTKVIKGLYVYTQIKRCLFEKYQNYGWNGSFFSTLAIFGVLNLKSWISKSFNALYSKYALHP